MPRRPEDDKFFFLSPFRLNIFITVIVLSNQLVSLLVWRQGSGEDFSEVDQRRKRKKPTFVDSVFCLSIILSENIVVQLHHHHILKLPC